MLAADSIAINRLEVRGDKRSSQLLVREIAHTGWSLPLPGHLQHAWVLIRHIEASGKAGDLRQVTGRKLHDQVLAAKDFRAGGAEQANAVWFESFPVLLAFLLSDVALGQATKWYWERWSYLLKYTRQEAIARVLFEHAEYLPAVISCLAARGQLQRVWSQLSSANAMVITRELARMHSLPAVETWQQGMIVVDVSSPAYFAELQQLKPAAYWQPLLAGLPRGDGRVLLACAIQGVIHAPLWLKRSPEKLLATFTAWAYVQTTGETQSAAKQETIRTSRNSELTELPAIEASTIAQGVNEPETQEVPTFLNAKLLTPQLPKSSAKPQSIHPLQNEMVSTDLLEVTSVSHYLERKNSEIFIDDSILQTEVSRTHSEEGFSAEDPTLQDYGFTFSTSAGGFFYLLNPLNRLLTAELLTAQAQANGWHWLLDLQGLLVKKFPHLDSVFDWPLKRFLLQQIAPNATEHDLKTLALQMDSTASGDFAQSLYLRLNESLQHSNFWIELEQSPGFFSTPARVIATSSHIDIYLPLNNVRLDLRVAAWDTNPGWLPWLGRVVAFHYVEQVFPGREVQV